MQIRVVALRLALSSPSEIIAMLKGLENTKTKLNKAKLKTFEVPESIPLLVIVLTNLKFINCQFSSIVLVSLVIMSEPSQNLLEKRNIHPGQHSLVGWHCMAVVVYANNSYRAWFTSAVVLERSYIITPNCSRIFISVISFWVVLTWRNTSEAAT